MALFFQCLRRFDFLHDVVDRKPARFTGQEYGRELIDQSLIRLDSVFDRFSQRPHVALRQGFGNGDRVGEEAFPAFRASLTDAIAQDVTR